MKTFIYVIVSLSFSMAQSQNNLVLNPSLEEYTSCPVSSGELYKVNHWIGSSVEFFHPCSPYWVQQTPNNDLGYQVPHDGLAYGGFYISYRSFNTYFPGEMAWVELGEILTKKWYCGGYFVSLANGSKIATDGFQLYFTSDSNLTANITSWEQYLAMLPMPAQVSYKNGIISDTTHWVNIEGAFIANGGEQYIYLGCFKDTLNITGVTVPGDPNVVPPSGSPNLAYYYFDDAYLYEMGKLPTAANHAYNCAAKTVTMRCDTGFNYRWYYLPDTVNVLSTADTFVVDASTAKNVLLRATLCSTEFADTVQVPKLDCTGLEDNLLAQGAALFPNPASHVANFSLQGTPPPGTRLHLTDLNGRELRTFAITGKTTELDLSGLSSGVYFVSYRFKENTIWKGKMCILDEK